MTDQADLREYHHCPVHGEHSAHLDLERSPTHRHAGMEGRAAEAAGSAVNHGQTYAHDCLLPQTLHGRKHILLKRPGDVIPWDVDPLDMQSSPVVYRGNGTVRAQAARIHGRKAAPLAHHSGSLQTGFVDEKDVTDWYRPLPDERYDAHAGYLSSPEADHHAACSTNKDADSQSYESGNAGRSIIKKSWLHEFVMGDGHDWTNLRARWDTAKTATPARRLALTCLAEFGGSWLYAFSYYASFYSVIWDWMLMPTVAAPNTPVMGLYLFLAAALAMWFSLIIFGPVAGGGHFVPQVTVAVTVLRCFPLWKAPFMIVAQCAGFFFGQLCAIWSQWDLFEMLKAAAKAATNNDPDAYFDADRTYGGKSISTLIIFKSFPQKSMWSRVFTEILINFIMAVILAAVVDISNPYSSVTSSAMPLAMAAAFMLVFFGLEGQANQASRWVSGFNCWILFGIRKGCFPMEEILYTTLVPCVAMTAGFLFYALFIADIRRPAAADLIEQVDKQVSELAARIVRQEAGM